jgi:transaldolase
MCRPLSGRLDDRGEDAMDLVRDIKKMYEHGDGHVHFLAASIRNLNHLLSFFALRAELATVPTKVLEEREQAALQCQLKISGTKGSMRGASL